MQDLGAIRVASINNLGQVVGGVNDAYLWTPATGMLYLGALPGGDQSFAKDINNLGQIVGLSTNAADEGHAVLWQPALPFFNATIDLNPKSALNIINIRYPKTVSIAILSSETFNAAAQVDRPSLTFGRTGDETSLFYVPPMGKLACTASDANGDGLADLLCIFSVAAMGFQCGDTQGNLKGSLVDGSEIQGKDTVKVTPCP
jgi:probable HAF family extracellular repeat protein